MEPQKTEPTLEDSLRQVMQTLPPFIREYLTEGKYTPVAQALMAKYKLRIDQGAVLERELMLLLMGVEDPAAFTKALGEDASLDQATVNGIVADINEKVFIPLRKEEENLIKASQKPVAPAPRTSAPQAPTRPIAPAAPHIAPLPPKTIMPSTKGLGDVLRTIMGPKPADPATLLEDHEEPHIDLKTQVVPPPQSAQSAKPMPQTAAPAPQPQAPSPVSEPKPAEASPKKEIVPPPPPLKIAPVTPLSQPKVPPPPPITSYSSDPYREPIDPN